MTQVTSVHDLGAAEGELVGDRRPLQSRIAHLPGRLPLVGARHGDALAPSGPAELDGTDVVAG